ncbi:MAG: phosphoadenosine phosphosulfate reductase family protein, partial [Candidatus Paceibacterota bacterium]
MFSENHLSKSLNHLTTLEREAARVLNEVRANHHRVSITFSAGKDSICIAHLAQKLFNLPGSSDRFPFKLFHYDSGDNFPEVLSFRNKFAKDIGAELVVFKVDERGGKDIGGVKAITELIHISV